MIAGANYPNYFKFEGVQESSTTDQIKKEFNPLTTVYLEGTV